MDDCDATAIIITAANRDTVADALKEYGSSVEHVLVVVDDEAAVWDNDISYHDEMATASREVEPANTGGEEDALLYYTSGTTGLAKGVLRKHRWIAGVVATQKYAVDLTDDDLYWSTTDLVWLTWPINTLGGWFWGATLFTYQDEFDPKVWISSSSTL